MSDSKKLRVVFMGTPEFSVPTLKTLIAEAEVLAVYTQPDKPVGRGLQMQPSPVKRTALEHGIPVFTPEKVSIPEEVERLQAYQADFFVVVAYGQILKLPVIQAPKYGTINIHSSLLPRWRGAAPIHQAILAGDSETGITTMMIAPKLDAGDIVLQEKTSISDEDTTQTVHDRLAEIGAKMILPTLRGLKDGSLKPVIQDESKVTYAHKLTKEMENLDWTKSARVIDLCVRALNPWPGTRIETSSGIKLKIKKGKPDRYESSEGEGTLFNHMGGLYLRCGQGSYQILELQEEGKKAISASDFLNGLKNRSLSLPLELKRYPGGTP
jgi:methionyl-tRNA formyltransferase